MNRITHDCQQGSQAWLDLRAKYFTASELAAAAGESKYQTRSALLKAKATGIAEEVDDAKQRLFDAGHASEAAARPIVERMVDAELYPVTMSVEVDGLPLLASLDGIDILGDVIWENKLRSESLVEQVNAGCLDPHYTYQIEQQLLVSGAGRCYFTTSDGTPEGTFGLWYESNPEIRAKIVSIWQQFAKDLAEYQHVEAKPEVVPSPTKDLPAIVYRLNGLSLTSNIDAYKEAATKLVEDSNKKLVTDQDFADRDYLNKRFAEAEKTIDIVSAQAIGEIKDVDKFCRDLSEIKGLIRQARINGENAVKTEKENRKSAIVNEASQQLGAHVIALQERVGVQFKPEVVNLADAIKGLKSLDSMRDKISVALANAKIEANAVADSIEFNQKQMQAQSAAVLFPDFIQVCTKAPDDFAALVAMRVSAKKEADEKLLADQREKIRAEEQAKAQREADATVAAERAEANRIAAEELRKIDAERKEKESQTRSQPTSTAAFETQPGATLKLGEINAMLAPVSVNADGLASLGIHPVAHEKNAKLYDANKFPIICRLISEHVMAQAFKKAA